MGIQFKVVFTSKVTYEQRPPVKKWIHFFCRFLFTGTTIFYTMNCSQMKVFTTFLQHFSKGQTILNKSKEFILSRNQKEDQKRSFRL